MVVLGGGCFFMSEVPLYPHLMRADEMTPPTLLPYIGKVRVFTCPFIPPSWLILATLATYDDKWTALMDH